MKKLLVLALAVMLAVTAAVTVAAQDVSVKINDVAVDFADVKPQIIEGRTMVPLRAIFEALNATVEWDDATKTVTSVREGVTVSLTIGQKTLTKNGTAVELDVPAQIIDSRTMVPVRAISEAFECKVDWDDSTKTVLVTYEVKPEAPSVYTEFPTYTADDSNAIGFYTEEDKQTLTVETDPLDESNKVLKITAVSEEQFWAYIWFNNFQYQAGATYKFSVDILPLSDATGAELDQYSAGLCFHFNGADKAVLPSERATIQGATWNYVETEFTIPEDYVPADDDRFGVYMNPADGKGITFMADNITIELVSGGSTAPAEKPEEKPEEKPAEAQKPATDGDVLTELPTQTIDDDNAIGFITMNDDQKLSVEKDPEDEGNKVLKITAVSDKQFWSYVWFDKFQYKAGVTYKFSANVRPMSIVDGTVHDEYSVGLCFRFSGADKCILGQTVSSNAWTYVETEFTIPEDYVYAPDDDRLGVYFNPTDEKGVTFMVDNIAVEIVG